MADDTTKTNPYFLQLVLSLQSAAWYQMGKTASPISGKVEKDLDQAKMSIDLLVMLQEKTRGNLGDEEKRILDSTVYNLQMNYVDELKQDKDNGPDKPADKAKNEATTPAPDSSGNGDDVSQKEENQGG